jgi:hypothetical protein
MISPTCCRKYSRRGRGERSGTGKRDWEARDVLRNCEFRDQRARARAYFCQNSPPAATPRVCGELSSGMDASLIAVAVTGASAVATGLTANQSPPSSVSTEKRGPLKRTAGTGNHGISQAFVNAKAAARARLSVVTRSPRRLVRTSVINNCRCSSGQETGSLSRSPKRPSAGRGNIP